MSTESPFKAPATRWRFWVACIFFLILNGVAWVVYDHYFAWWHRGSLRVESFEPGDNAIVEPHAVLRWRFSDDVLPTTVYGKEPGRISPAVAGRWNWENPRTLCFMPAVDFPRATPVTFTLASELIRTGTGAALGQPYVTSIHSSPLLVQSIRQSETLDNDQFVISLKFSDRVAPGDVLQHITATLPDGHAVHCRLYGQMTGDIIRLATDTVPVVTNDAETPLEVKLLPGLTGMSGPLGLANPYEVTVNLGRKLVATQMTAVAQTHGQQYLQLSFNNPIDTSVLKKVLSIEPAVPFLIEMYGNETVQLHGGFQPGTRYTARIAAMPPGVPGSDKPRYPRAGQLAAFMPDKGKDVWFDSGSGYLSTSGNRTVLVHAVNVEKIRVSISRMYDNNLVAWRNTSENVEAFSKPVASKTISLPGGKNVQRDLPIDIDDLLPPQLDRAGVWRVSAAEANPDSSDDGESSRTFTVITLSDIGLTAKQTRAGLVAWATSLRTAQPLADVRVRAYSSKNQLLGEGTTDADGLVRLNDLHPAKEESLTVLLANAVPQAAMGPTTQPAESADLTWLDLRRTNWEMGDSDISGQPYLRSGNSAFVYTDRGVYRPGETLHLRGIVRSAGDVAPQNTFPVKWQLRRPDQHDWKNQTAMLDADGAASADIPLPTDLPSGRWTATLSLPGDKAQSFGDTNFQIEDFIPNRLKVNMLLRSGEEKSPKRYTISETPLDVEVQADYLFGRPGAGLAVDLSSHAARVAFHPTGWDGWAFGDAAGIANVPDSLSSAATKSIRPNRKKAKASEAITAGSAQQPDSTTLDEHGRYSGSVNVADIVHFAEDSDKTAQYLGPWLVTTDAGVREAGGRAVTASQQISVDALPAYIGARRADGKGTATPGQTSYFEIKLVKPDGAPASDAESDLQAQLLRQTWNTTLVFRDGHYQYESARVLNPVAPAATLHLKQGLCQWVVMVPDSGQYFARLTDPTTGAITTLGFYSTNGSGWDENVDRQNPERLDLRVLRATENENSPADKKPAFIGWQAGDTARVLVSSPFKGRLLLSVETDDVVQTTVVEMTSSHMVVPVKVTAACWPNAFISATVIRAIDPNAKWQTHRAFGVARLNLDPDVRRLQMALSAPEILRPLQSLDVDVSVTDPDGNAVSNAAITVAAVDEGICSLTSFKTPDPLNFFSARRALGVQSGDVFSLLMPEVARPLGQREVGGDKPAPDMGRYRSQVGARRVSPVALAWAQVRSDANGIARASFPLPQFQGRLRIMAVGYTAKLLGSVDRGVTVRSPILAQSSWPRFAAPGDRFTVPIVIFNNSPNGGDARVSVQLLNDQRTPAGLIGFGPDAKSRIELPPLAMSPGGQKQVNLDVAVAAAVGVAKVRLNVAIGTESFQEDVEFPVRPASPLTQFGGTRMASTTQPIAIDQLATMMPGTDSLRVNLTPWPTLNLPRGLDYLDRYPYGCCEQTISACFPLIALGDIGRKIDPVQFDPQRIKFKIDAGVTRLIGLQTAEGGLSMWPGETDAWPWGSIYAAHFLTEAKSAGYEIPDDFYNHLLSYVRHQMDVGTDDASLVETQAYAAYVMALAGKPDRTILDRLTELTRSDAAANDRPDAQAMRGDARLMLSSAWLLAGRRDLAQGMLPQSFPLPRINRQLGGNLGSPIRDRAMLILALEQVEPDRPELPDLVQQLADCGVHDQWSSTQDAAFSILAIGHYLRDEQKKTPYESARLLLGETVLAEAHGGDSIAWKSDANQLKLSSGLKVELTGPTDAVGHLSWLQSGVPMAPPADAEHGLKIHRQYLTLDGKDLGQSVVCGEQVRVQLTIEGPPDQPNLVIEDLLPAGLEVENPRLETAAKDRGEATNQALFGNGRIDIRDDRVIICGQMPGTWKAHCSYLARAITPGTYTVPPVRAEAMYDFNTNAISGSGKLTVLPVAGVLITKVE